LLLGLVLGAGCSGFGDLDSASTTETLTPAPVPEEPRFAPGVPVADGEQTVVNTNLLLRADTAERSTVSYRLHRRVSIRGANWTTQIDRERRVGTNGTLFERLEINGSGPLSPTIERSELWTNGSTAHVRTFAGSDGPIEQTTLPSAPGHFQRWVLLREQVLTDRTYRVEPTADGVVLHSAELSDLPVSVIPFSMREPRNATARLVVMETGLIRSVRLQYETAIRGEPAQVVIRHRLRAVGNTTVDRPTWTG
jgi:hypothetical protein